MRHCITLLMPTETSSTKTNPLQDNQGVWDALEHTAIFKMDNQQGMAQGNLLNVMWQPGWEGSLGENGYMYMYG